MHFLFVGEVRSGLYLRFLVVDGAEVELRVVHVLVEIFLGGKTEGFLYVLSRLGTDLEVGKGSLLNLLPYRFAAHLPIGPKIAFIPKEDLDHLLLVVALAEVNPFVEGIEGALVLMMQ